MNLIEEGDGSLTRKLLTFLSVLLSTTAVTTYTVLKSRGLSEFLEKLSDERVLVKAKVSAFLNVWRTKQDRLR